MKNIFLKKQKKNLYPIILFVFVILFVAFNIIFKIEFSYRFNNSSENNLVSKTSNTSNLSNLESSFFPEEGTVLPVKWGDLGKQLLDNGVIDGEQFEAIYAQRGGLQDYEKTLIDGTSKGKIKITKDNANFLLNLFWAFGLSNNNQILTEGPMQDEQYDGAGGFASTGGWTIAKGDSMEHYSKHDFVTLTEEQQILVENVSQNIYRPCCDNPTYFPDCNHGMAMLGFLELMAAQGATEKEMYEAALVLNFYWFPNNYLTIASYFDSIGKSLKDVDPKEILGINYSSSSGYRQVLAKVNPVQSKGGASCGV